MACVLYLDFALPRNTPPLTFLGHVYVVVFPFLLPAVGRSGGQIDIIMFYTVAIRIIH